MKQPHASADAPRTPPPPSNTLSHDPHQTYHRPEVNNEIYELFFDFQTEESRCQPEQQRLNMAPFGLVMLKPCVVSCVGKGQHACSWGLCGPVDVGRPMGVPGTLTSREGGEWVRRMLLLLWQMKRASVAEGQMWTNRQN